MNVAHSSSGSGANHGKNAAAGKRRSSKFVRGKKGKRQFKDQAELMDYIVSISSFIFLTEKNMEPKCLLGGTF